MNKDKFIIIPFLVLSFFMVYHSEGQNNRALVWISDEREFFKPIEVVWRGEIISTMVGGSCMGLKGEFSNYHLAMACFSGTDSIGLWKFEGMVTVSGKWLGITCAYKNTIFGECVPDVVIESIRQN